MMFLDTDFKDRTLLKVITFYGFRQLFMSYKVDVLLQEIWVGKNSFECDGRISDFSMLTYLSRAPIKKLPGKTLTARELLSNNFEAHIEGEKYWYQFKYRRSSIAYIF